MTPLTQSIGSLVIVATLLTTVCADAPPEWDRRQSQEHGWIYDDFDAGVANAKETGKPMLVVLRCPP